MSGCNDKKMAEMLHAFELGLLSPEDRARVEQHIIECDDCFAQLQQLAGASRLLKLDEETRSRVRDLSRHAVEPELVGASFRDRWRLLAPAAIITAVFLLLILKDWRVDIHREEIAVASEERLAVLPFENLAQPDDSSHMGEVVANLLITDLSQSSSLQVVSSQYIYDLQQRARASGDKSEKEIREKVAQQANARWRLDGAISQVAEQAVMSAQIVDVATGVVKVSTRVTIRPDQSVFAAVDQMSSDLRKALLKPSAGSARPTRSVMEMTTSSPEAYQEYVLGLDAYRKWFNREAESHFERAVQLDSTFAMPYYYLSLRTSRLDWRVCLEKAVKYSDRAGDRDRYLITIRASNVSNDWRKTLSLLEKFVERYKDEKEPLFQLALTEYSWGWYSKAVVHLNAAVALDSLYSMAWNQLAYTYDRLGDFDNAVRAIDRCVALEPNLPNPYDSRGEIYARNGKLDLAIESYRQALIRKPDFYSSLSSLGAMYAFSEDYVRAESCFAAVAKSPSSTDRRSAANFYAYVAAYQGHLREAIRRMDDAIAADSAFGSNRNLPFRLFWKSVIYEAAGDRTQAVGLLERSVALDSAVDKGDFTRKRSFYVHLLAEAGQIDRARQVAAALKKMVDSAEYYEIPYFLSMASIALAGKTPDSAVQYFTDNLYQIATAYDYSVLARSYLTANRLADAVATLQVAMKRYTPNRLFWSAESVKFHYYLARAYEESRWYPQAAEEYRKFLAIWKSADPGIKEIADAQARLQRLEHRQ